MPNQPTPPRPARPHLAPVAALTLAAALFASNAAGLAVPLLRGGDKAWTPEEEITVDELKADLTWLADDDRQGRGILTPGLNEAGGFIADRFKALGLKPIDGLDGYYHTFDLPFGSELIKEKTSLAAEGGKALALGQDYIPLAWSKPAEFEGELVFAGYGISSERYHYDDFAGADVQGKVVLVMRNEPRGKDGKSAFTNSDRNSREGSTTAKARAAERAGAAAVILVDQPIAARGEGDGEGAADKLMEFGRGAQRAGIPVFHVTRGVANQWLRQAGMPNLRKLQQDIDAKLEPATQAGRKPVTIKGGFAAEPKSYQLRNVAGVVPGRKADEFIVVGAHYDTARGSPGADDNASGVAALLALAHLLPYVPLQRTVRLVAFVDEEPPHTRKPSMGSVRYADALLREGPCVTAMVSLEMLGIYKSELPWPLSRIHPLRSDVLALVGDRRARPVLQRAKRAFELAGSGIDVCLLSLPLFLPGVRSSDHWSFAKRNIPSFMVTDMGPLRSRRYHSRRDTPRGLDYDRIGRATAAIATMIRELATVELQPEGQRGRSEGLPAT